MKENLKILLRAILAGIMISIGGTIYLMLDRSPFGAFLFGIGLFMICIHGYNLYTGKIGYLVYNKIKYLIELAITLVGNFIGTFACGYVLSLTRIGVTLRERASVICNIKIADGKISIFVLSIFCGMLMFLAVDLFKRTYDVGKYLAVFLCVTVFILAGFEHCVANMYYFAAAGMWSWKVLLYLYIMIMGNSVGSIIIALGNKYGLMKKK